MRGRNVVSWTACFEWWRRGERVISGAVDDLLEIVKRETDCWEAGVKMSRIAWKCITYLKNANADIAPAVTRAAGAPQQHLHRHNMLQCHCGSLLSRTKSSRTWWPRLKAAMRVCSLEQAQPEQNFYWVHLEEGKKNVKDKNMIWWPGENRGSELPAQNQIDSRLKYF